MTAADWRGFWSPHQCRLHRSPKQVKLEIATTLRWSCAPVSEWVSDYRYIRHSNIQPSATEQHLKIARNVNFHDFLVKSSNLIAGLTNSISKPRRSRSHHRNVCGNSLCLLETWNKICRRLPNYWFHRATINKAELNTQGGDSYKGWSLMKKVLRWSLNYFFSSTITLLFL